MIRPRRQRPAVLLAAVLASAGAYAADAPEVSQACARATPPGVEVGAAYMVILGGSRADALVGADTERAPMVHLHVVEESDGLSRMRSIESVDVPPGRRIELQPKSTHLMLMGLDGPRRPHWAGCTTRTSSGCSPAASDGGSWWHCSARPGTASSVRSHAALPRSVGADPRCTCCPA